MSKKQSKDEWIYQWQRLTKNDLWNMFPHKRNQYLSNIEWNASIQMFQIESMKKKYRKKK